MIMWLANWLQVIMSYQHVTSPNMARDTPHIHIFLQRCSINLHKNHVPLYFFFISYFSLFYHVSGKPPEKNAKAVSPPFLSDNKGLIWFSCSPKKIFFYKKKIIEWKKRAWHDDKGGHITTEGDTLHFFYIRR